jgi:hypothetical protein
MKKDIHFVMALTGAAMVVGFFLPFLDVGVAGASGWDIVRSDAFAWTTRLAVACLPLGGAALALAGLTRSDGARKISWTMGAGILGFLFFKLAWGFFKVTGTGLWMVIGAATIALLVGLGSRKRSA